MNSINNIVNSNERNVRSLEETETNRGIIEIDNKIIRPTPLGIERCKLDKSLYS